jgi:hypothetical protein
MPRGPKSYGSYADFTREELKPMNRIGFCVDDLEAEAMFQAGTEEIDDGDREALDFGR